MRRRLGRAVAAIALLALPFAGSPAAAQESPGAQLVEVCSQTGVIDIDELGPRACVSFEAGSVLLSSVCGLLPLPPEACAAILDGRVIDPTAVDAYQDSWVHRALRLQERLDRNEPMRNSLVPHTHNSANTTADLPSVSNADPNQRYSIADQLRMDIRGIELDLHWVPSLAGTAETGGNAVVLCHGRSEGDDEVVVHVGCSVDRPLRDGLVEIRDHLAAPGNDDQVLLLYLENQLDDDPVAHDTAIADLDAVLGDLVLRPPSSECTDAPMDTSRQDVLDAGHQIVLVGDCGPGGWNGWVHDRGPLWDENGHDGDYPSYPECIDTVRADRDYDANWIRHWEDLTWLSAMVEGDRYPITPEVTRSMVRCGVDMIGFDRLEPDDGRLEALVWSWAVHEPTLDPDLACAARDDDGRFRMQDCAEVRSFSCRTPAGAWLVSETADRWAAGDSICAGIGATFAVPPTGWENERLGAVAAVEVVWIPIGLADVGGTPAEVVTSPVVDPAPAADPVASGGSSLPATGRTTPMAVALGALILAVSARRLVHRRG